MFQNRFALAALALVASITPAQQSEPRPWTGTLRDPSGNPIATATIHLHSTKTQLTATTGSTGRFTFPAPPAGEYSLSVDYNHATANYSGKLELPVSALETVLRLTTDGSLTVLQDPAARESTGGEQLSSKAVSSLPLNKRDFSQLLLLAAGTMTDTNGAANFTQQFAVNGQRGTAAVFAMDGADSTDPEMGGATFSNFNVDAVQEIRSSSGWMPAEIGRGAAGFTDIITRSGTNADTRIGVRVPAQRRAGCAQFLRPPLSRRSGAASRRSSATNSASPTADRL